jgi:CHAT domain-containing protein
VPVKPNWVDILKQLSQPARTPDAMERRIELCHRALKQVQRDGQMERWAYLHFQLGLCFAQLPDGDRIANLEKAIENFGRASEVYMHRSYPKERRAIQRNLANLHYDVARLYAQRAEATGADDLERAIKHYRAALETWTPEKSPYQWAQAKHGLGFALFRRSDGSRKQNLEQAIACYEAALSIRTPDEYPAERAETQHNLGLVYMERYHDNRAENLERAIELLVTALETPQHAKDQVKHAKTRSNLGTAYLQRIRGERVDNVQQAIECYQEALAVQEQVGPREELAATNHNLGIAYAERLLGNRGANLRQAIKHLNWALEGIPERTFRWAMAHNVLSDAHWRLGNYLRHTDSKQAARHLEQALKCAQTAAEVYEQCGFPRKWALGQHNLGNAYCDRIQGNRAKNLEEGIQCYRAALEIRTQEAYPFEWAQTQNNLGVAYWERVYESRKGNLEKAVRCFCCALEIHTPDAFPVDARRAARNLGNLLFGEGRWTEAHGAYTTALQAAKALYTAAFMEAGREAEISENAALYAHDAFCLTHLGQLKEALVQLEEGKTRTLAERLGRDAAQLEKARPEDQKAYRELRDLLKALEAEQRAGGSDRSLVGTGRPYTEIARDVKRAREELNTLTQLIHGYLPDFLPAPLDFVAIQALVPDERTALAEFCVTEKGSVVLVIRPEEEPEPVWIEEFTQTDLSRTVHNWMAAYLSRDHTRWRATIERVLNEIGLRLVAPLHTILQKYGITHLIVIPQGSLFLLPLHAALIGEDSARLLDRYEVSYAPSAAVLQRCRERAVQACGQGLFAVINPQEDPNLVFTLVEGENIASLFPKDQRVLLEEHEGTKKAVLQNAKGRGYLHFSCHGIYNWSEPLQSGLLLTDPDHLTLEDLQQPYLEFESEGKKERAEVDMTAAHLVTLSACETGITEATTSRADEYVGLPAGFMLAGVPCVVSSLWSVPDLSTALLMERFYVNHLRRDPDACGDPDENLKTRSPLSPSEALRRAQIWLRDEVTVREAAERCDEQIDKLESRGEDVPTWLSRAWRKYAQMARKTPDSRPFAHPFHWAAFALYGATQDPERAKGVDNYARF